MYLILQECRKGREEALTQDGMESNKFADPIVQHLPQTGVRREVDEQLFRYIIPDHMAVSIPVYT